MPRRTTHIAPACPTATNACGRLLRVDDGTGYQIFSYDKLGNVSENIRTFALPFEDSVYNFRMMFEYDSWNRVQRIVYPDSEVVTYNYDLAGQLYSVSAFKNNVSSSLINSILYDEFGHRTQVNFGNGVTTNYSYDILQRLNTLQTYSNNASLQKISYSFDYEDNITRVENTAGGANGLGGGYTFDYQYDNLYRLTSSTGTFAPNGASYGLEMDFTPAGRVCRKFQDYTGTGNVYAYSQNSKQHAVRRIYNGLTNELSNLLWDANGNLAQIAEYSYDPATETATLQDFRNHYWDEDDRLNLVLDNSHFSYYLYGHDGQRVAKITSDWVVNWGGYGFSNSATINSGTLYLSEYMVCDGLGYTKYYYAGGTRIAARWGGGGFDKMQRLCTLDRNLTHNASDLFNAVVARIGENMPLDCPSDPCPAHISDNEEFGVQLPTLNFETGFYIYDGPLYFVKRGLRTNRNGKLFFFHGDQLGSANWVTLQNASPTQFLLHLPYGEEFVKQLGGSYDERFTFTGKEKDIETGYYYFGARFDNVDLGFMSVDPMSDKYPNISPYAYCAWNPVKLVDEDGEEIWISGNDGNLYQYKRGKIFDSNGKKYSGSDEFVNKVYSDLKWLRRNGIRRELREMERNRHKITIYETDKGSQQISLDEKGQSNGVGCSSNILFNPTIYKLEYDGETLPMYGLAHELGHAYDAMLGIIDDTFEPVYENGSNFTDKYIKKSEIRAVRFENYVRPADFQRTSYRGLDLRSFGVTKPKPQTNTTPDSKDAINLYDLKIKQFE